MGGFVGTPAEQAGAVAEAAAGEVVVLELGDELGFEGLPLGAAFGGPAAWAAGGVAGEAGRRDEWLEHFGEFFALVGFEGGAEADVVEEALVIVEAEQERAEEGFGIGCVAEAAYHTVGGAEPFYFDHAVAIGGLIGHVKALGDDAVECAADAGEPLVGDLDFGGGGGEDDLVIVLEIFFGEGFEGSAAGFEGLIGEEFAVGVDEHVEED